MRLSSQVLKIVIIALIFCCVVFYINKTAREKFLLQKIIERLSADSRVAQAVVSDVRIDPQTNKTYTTIKFQEYDAKLEPLKPKYFTFSNDIIQFQAMVIRFDDFYIKKGHPLKGKSAYIFTKVFMLTEKNAEVFEINKLNEIPSGYQVDVAKNSFEKQLWQKFWKYALQQKAAKRLGIKNAQIEAPGTKFIPGMIYTLKIEHDGGLRIDSEPIAPILREKKAGF